MEGQLPRIQETLGEPDEILMSDQDDSVYLYYKQYSTTPVTEKYLLVVAKLDIEDPFVITAFYTDRIKSGRSIK